MNLPDVVWLPLLPLLVVVGSAVTVLCVDLALPSASRVTHATLSISGLAAAGLVAALLWGHQGTTLAASFRVDDFALYCQLLFCAGTAVSLLISVDYLDTTDVKGGDYYVLALFATVGMMLMAGANDLVVLFLGLEVMSVAVYVLAGIWRRQLGSNEAALKYFLLGAFATGFLLFGIALVYAATGTTHIDILAARAGSLGETRALLVLGVVFLLVGFGFKVAAVPFHAWTPDVYEGSPTSVTALMAVGVKAAAFAAFARVFLAGLASVESEWRPIVWWLAVLTMSAGNLLAITQTSFKRMLAYSSIAHAGYLLVALLVGGIEGGSALLFYLLAYAVTNLGAFAVSAACARPGDPGDAIESMAGLGSRRPLLALALTLFMLSLAGIPPLVGFAGKLAVFGAAVSAGEVGLAVVGVLNSLVSAAYYIGVIVVLYMKDGTATPPSLADRPWLAGAITLSAVGTVLLGCFPGPAVELARSGFQSLLP